MTADIIKSYCSRGSQKLCGNYFPESVNQTDRQTDRQTTMARQTDRQTDRTCTFIFVSFFRQKAKISSLERLTANRVHAVIGVKG